MGAQTSLGCKDLGSTDKLLMPKSAAGLFWEDGWKRFVDRLYRTDWNVYIKQTFNGNGNAIEYLSRYANRNMGSGTEDKTSEKDLKKLPQPDRIQCRGSNVIFSTVPLCLSLCLGVERTGNIFSGCFFAKTEA